MRSRSSNGDSVLRGDWKPLVTSAPDEESSMQGRARRNPLVSTSYERWILFGPVTSKMMGRGVEQGEGIAEHSREAELCS